MLDQLVSITIKRGFFDRETEFQLFRDNKRLAIIYGKNGSGKTAISDTLKKKKEGILETNDVCIFKANDDVALDPSNIIDKIHVFNEEYIDQNVKFSDSDGLKSVVMFGEQVAIDNKINKLEKSLTERKNELKTYGLDEFEKKGSINNPQTHLDSCKEQLKNGWAIRDRDIKGNHRATAVKDSIFDEVIKYKNNDDLIKLNSEFRYKLNDYIKIKSDDTEKALIPLPPIIDFEDELILLVNKKINKPLSDELQEKILKVIDKIGYDQIHQIETKIVKSEMDFCPLCMQKVDSIYKKELEKSIKMAINEEMQSFIKDIDKFFLKEIKLDLDDYNIIDEKLVQQLKDKCDKINTILGEYRLLIEQRKDRIFDEFNEEKKGYEDIYDELVEIIKALNQKIISFNTGIKARDEIIEELYKLNYKIAYLEIESTYNSYLSSQKKKDEVENKYIQINEQIKRINEEIELLNARKKNVDIAYDIINKNLEYIFYDKNRLTVELNNDKYYVKSYGQNVSLDKLSTGERNVISLCYFFVDILNNCNEKSMYCNDLFIVLDDPISSFDIENKVGIFSYLRSIIGKIINKNENSKIIIFTHELESFFHFEKISLDLSYRNNTYFGQLKNKTISDFNADNKNIYNELLRNIYSFAKGERNDLESTIGNMMRRVLEAFATFNYKTGIESLSTDTQILNKLENDQEKDHFSNLMYRLVLHNESHLRDATYAITENNLFTYISLDEKRKTAQSILVFLYILNDLHIKKHLGDINEIEKWKQGLFQDSELEDTREATTEIKKEKVTARAVN